MKQKSNDWKYLGFEGTYNCFTTSSRGLHNHARATTFASLSFSYSHFYFAICLGVITSKSSILLF
jgi:low temperature requirement protein LtrA